MVSASSLAAESCRLAALHSLDLLDTPPEARFDWITRLARRVFDVPIALVSLVDVERQWFKSRAGLDVSETPRNVSFCTYAVEDNAVLVVPDAALDDRFRTGPLVTGDPHIRFYAGAPIRAACGYAVGTLCVIDRQPRSLSSSDLVVLRDLAGAVEQQFQHAESATTDFLTGLLNRRGACMLGSYMLGAAAREGVPSTVLMLDLDHFKRINDTYGHAVGDSVLVHFARALSGAVREADIAARLGGDEFCAVLLGATSQSASNVLARVDAALAASSRELGFPIGYSVGTATVAGDGARLDLDALLCHADRAMYTEKREHHGLSA